MRNSADPVSKSRAWFGQQPTPNPGTRRRDRENRRQPISCHFVLKRQTSEENMTANRTQNPGLDERLILELRIDASGEVTRKPTKLGRKDTLEGKLLGQLYPGIRVARVSVPHDLTPYEESVVENRMASLSNGGIEYKLVGGSSATKKGVFYFVDKAHAGPIAERFQHWPEGGDSVLCDPRFRLQADDRRACTAHRGSQGS